MEPYLVLFRHTTEAKTNIGNASEWLEEGLELSDTIGGEVAEVYYGNIGEFDAVAIVNYPDAESVEQTRLAFEQMGNHDIETYRLFEADEYLEMIEDLPA